MEIKILQVFYDKNGLPYKDKERTVHYPITSGTFLGASNTTQIRFYYDQLDELNESTFVAVSKLPNGKIGSEILESAYDSELQENYAVLNLSQFYTQYKGDVYISLQGYQGGVRVEQDENGIYQIYGTPTIQATGSIKLNVAYAPTFIGSGQTENVNFQRVLAELSTKLGIRQETLHVEELPTIGNPNVWYVVNDDPNDTTKANIYIWNAKTQSYVWVGDNTLNLGDYYTQEEGQSFEQGIENRVQNVEDEVSSVASGSPAGVYATASDLLNAYPNGDSHIYIVLADGNWYYWDTTTTEWTAGGQYLSSGNSIVAAQYLNKFNYNEFVTDLNDVNTNKIFILDYSSDVLISNLPSDIFEGTFLVYCYTFEYNQSTNVYKQLIISQEQSISYSRLKIGSNSWSSWEKIGYKDNHLITQFTYTDLTNFNNALENTKYLFTNLNLYYSNISNIPSIVNDGVGELETITFYYDDNLINKMQIFNWYSQNKYFYRYFNGSSWTDWENCNDDGITWLNSANYSEIVTNWNNIKENKNFFVSDNTSWNGIQHSPKGVDGAGMFLIYKNYYSDTVYCITQIVVNGSKLFMRYYYSHTNTWTEWTPNPELRKKIIIGSSSNANYNDLATGFAVAFSEGNCDVYIEDGTYDLSSQIVSLGQGIEIGNNCRYIFSSNSKIVCNYGGDSTTVQEQASIFVSGMGQGDFEIINLTATASRIRYIIHDENGGEGGKPYRHIFKNCKLTLDNTNNSYRNNYYHCIGGGLGINGYIEINDCILNSVYVPSGQGDAQYHGNWSNETNAQNGKSNLVVKNSYFAHTFSVSSPNNETQKKQLIFSCNSVAYDLVYNETSNTYWDVYKWNNEIRGS